MQQYKLFFLLLTVLSALGSSSISQPSQIKRTWHWYFGNHAGIDFSSGTAVADTNGALVTSEGCAAISDTSGVLQFYSDGRTVWNRNHQVMPNGTGIMGGANGSSTQQALIIPKPQSPNLYYLFTTDEAENNGANGMRYTVVDMNLDGGNGDVDTTQKNILLFAPCTEKLAAVNHCNDTNVWVMGHEVNNNHFRAYLVTANGIDTNAVVSAVGFPNMSNALGQMNGPIKFSPDGKMLCQVTDTNARRVELFQFDNYTGVVSNRITLSTNTNFNYGISFSPDNSKVYVGNMFYFLFQYSVSVFDSIIISNSKILIDDESISGKGFRYIINSVAGVVVLHLNLLDTAVSLIANPNLAGTACSLQLFSISLLHPSTKSALPMFNESYFRLYQNSVCNTGLSEVENNTVNFFPNPARDWIEVRGSGIKEIAVFDVLGNLGYKAVGGFASPQKIDVSRLSNGVYILRLSSATKIITTKFLKQ